MSAVLGLALVGTAGPLTGQQPVETGEPPRYENFDRVVKGSKEYDGLFKLHQKEDRLYAEIRPDQFDKPFSCPSPSPAAPAWAATRSTSAISGCSCSSASATRFT
jgi:hypothetical protein